MKKHTILLCFIFFFNGLVLAQTISVVKIEKIEALADHSFWFPRQGINSDLIYLTKDNYQGIYAFDLKSKRLQTITTDAGAGYNFIVAPAEKAIYYRTNRYIGFKKFSSLVKYSIPEKSKTFIEKDQRELSPPLKLASGYVAYTKSFKPQLINISGAVNKNQALPQPVFAALQNRKIALYRGKEKNVLQPMGEGIYLWPSVSPKGDRLLFTVAGKGTYISDLEGNILVELGYANAPQWSPDGRWVVYMTDKDDGHFITESEIWVSSADGKRKIQITNTKDIHEMYPSWSTDNKNIFFCTDKGEIYIAEIR